MCVFYCVFASIDYIPWEMKTMLKASLRGKHIVKGCFSFPNSKQVYYKKEDQLLFKYSRPAAASCDIKTKPKHQEI